MTDPAVEAAERAVRLHYPPRITEPSPCEIDSAREALKPIREWYHKGMACEADANELAPLIFTTEELER